MADDKHQKHSNDLTCEYCLYFPACSDRGVSSTQAGETECEYSPSRFLQNNTVNAGTVQVMMGNIDGLVEDNARLIRARRAAMESAELADQRRDEAQANVKAFGEVIDRQDEKQDKTSAELKLCHDTLERLAAENSRLLGELFEPDSPEGQWYTSELTRSNLRTEQALMAGCKLVREVSKLQGALTFMAGVLETARAEQDKIIGSMEAGLRKALLGKGPEKPDEGIQGARDPDHPCEEYRYGPKHMSADCMSDGHYLCQGCQVYEGNET